LLSLFFNVGFSSSSSSSSFSGNYLQNIKYNRCETSSVIYSNSTSVADGKMIMSVGEESPHIFITLKKTTYGNDQDIAKVGGAVYHCFDRLFLNKPSLNSIVNVICDGEDGKKKLGLT
jgi:hypothetical protein